MQYINTPGTHTLVDKDGIVLVAAAGDVTLTGTTSADILVTPAAKGKTLAFDKATITGAVTVQADGMKVTKSDSSLPDIVTAGKDITVEDAKPATPATPGGSGGGGGNSGGHNPAKGTVSLTASKTMQGPATTVPVGAVITASISNPNSAAVVWLVGGVETTVTNQSYTVTAADLGKEIQVKLVKDNTDEAVSNKFTVEKSTITTIDSLKTEDTSAPVKLDSGVKFVDPVTKKEVSIDASAQLVLSIEPKAVTEDEAKKVTENSEAKTVLVNAVESVLKEVTNDSSASLTDKQKTELANATKVIAVDVDLTLVKTEGEETTETAVHPVGNTTVTLSAAQLGLAGEDLNLYHFNANHTNANGDVQNIPGTVNANPQGVGVSVTFKTNGLSTIWIGNVPPRTVTFDTKGGSAVASQKVRFGSTVDTGKVGTPTRSGYLFCGWNYDLAKTPVIRDMKVEAKWVAGTSIPKDRYTVTLTNDASLTKEAADGKYTIKANPDGTYTANITASVSVTPYANAAKYVVSAAADTAANTTDPKEFHEAGSGSIAMDRSVTITNSEGKIVAGRTSYYIKWVDAKGNVLALEELTVVVDNGQGAAETMVVTRNINRGVGTFEPYLTSTTTGAPRWVGYIKGDPRRQYSHNSDEWEYHLDTNVRFERHGGSNVAIASYSTFCLDFTPFSGENYAGKAISAQAQQYNRTTHKNDTFTASATVDNTTGHLIVSIPLDTLNAPADSYNIHFTMEVTVGGATQEIGVSTLNPKYENQNMSSELVEATDLAALKSALQNASSNNNKNWNINYTGTEDITLAEALTIPNNAEVYFSDHSFTVGSGGVLTMESSEGRAAQLGIGQGAFTVASGGKLVVRDIRSGEHDDIWIVSIHAPNITVADGGTVEVNPNSSLHLSGNDEDGSSQCGLNSGSLVTLNGSENDVGHLDISNFNSVSFNGNIKADNGGYLYVYNDNIQVGGTIQLQGGNWINVEFYGDTTVTDGGKIQVSGQNSNLDLQCPLTNKGEIALLGGAYGIFTNTGFAQYNSGTISVDSSSTINLEGTKLVNIGRITGSGTIYAMLGDDVTDYAANHTGLEFVEVQNETLDNYSRYKFTKDPAATINVTLYKGEVSNEQGGTMASSIHLETEEFPAN